MGVKWYTAIIFSFCAIAGSNVSAVELSEVPDPPGSSVTYVGEVVQNGLPLQIKQFVTNSTPVEVISFYKQKWSDAGTHQKGVPPYIEKDVGDWRIVSRLDSNFNTVVQVRTKELGQSEGYISVSDLSTQRPPSEISNEFPKIVGSDLISSTESVDQGRIATTIVLVNDYSIDENSEYYRSSMDSFGWTYVQGTVKSNVSLMSFSKQGQKCDIAISDEKNGKTVIFANILHMDEHD